MSSPSFLLIPAHDWVTPSIITFTLSLREGVTACYAEGSDRAEMLTTMLQSNSVLVSGVMMPLCAGVLWALYKYRSWGKRRRIVDVNTQNGLYRSVLLESVHGQPESVMEIYKTYAERHYPMQEVLFNPEQDTFLAEVVKQAQPRASLVLGTQLGYSAIRVLSLLPSQAKLYAVEQDQNVAEKAEELILMAGFKNTQFQMLSRQPVDQIQVVVNHFGFEKVDFVLMDHQPFDYLKDLINMEVMGALHPGTLILANHTEDSTAKDFLKHIQCDQSYSIRGSCKDLLKIEFVGLCLSKETINKDFRKLKVVESMKLSIIIAGLVQDMQLLNMN
ncbi:transmembrane O-methyltransferase homolog [Discoglossus pictus]